MESGRENDKRLHAKIRNMARKIDEHESAIIDKLFEKGPIDGIDAISMKTFVRSRINMCLVDLGVKPIWKIKDNQIAEWFYKGINDYQFVDFFSGIGREYTRGWDATRFVWKVKS